MAQNPTYQSPTAGRANGIGTEPPSGAGEYYDKNLARNRRLDALAARNEFLNMISEAPSTNADKIMKIRLESTAPVPMQIDNNGSTTTFAGRDTVTFNITPDISESQQVIYNEIADIRQAASILIYMGSPARNWNITAKFLARTPGEAEATYLDTQLLKSWSKPDNNYVYADNDEAPHVLRLRGYGAQWKGIPVVIRSLNFEHSSEVDYVRATGGADVPIVQTVSIQLTEARTPDELDTFDLEKFKLGILPNW